jgi:hypothetical protein
VPRRDDSFLQSLHKHAQVKHNTLKFFRAAIATGIGAAAETEMSGEEVRLKAWDFTFSSAPDYR